MAAATAPTKLNPFIVRKRDRKIIDISSPVAIVMGVVFLWLTRMALWKEMRTVRPGIIVKI